MGWNFFLTNIMQLNQSYWQERYFNNDTPWDIGKIAPPLRHLIGELPTKEIKVLIPGAGRAYEAIYMHQEGYRQVHVCDWVEDAFTLVRQNAAGFPEANLHCIDFFEMEGQFDLILEQTFFCALEKSSRSRYVEKVSSLLKPRGILAGLLFASEFSKEGPPFGGTKQDYQALFESHFEITILEIAKNSILPRAQNELFFKFIRK